MTAVAALGVAVAAGIGAPAFANSGAAMEVELNTASVHMVQGTTCQWTVTGSVTVVNLTNESLALSAVGNQVPWTGTGGASGVVTNDQITVLSDGGLAVGDTIAPDATVTYSPYSVQLDLPCSAQNADLEVSITTQEGTGSGDVPFLANGKPLPIGLVGAIGLVFGIGLIGLVDFLRRRWTKVRLQPAVVVPMSSRTAVPTAPRQDRTS